MAAEECARCSVCDEELRGKTWIGLNRFVLGTKLGTCMSELHDEHGVCQWHLGEVPADDRMSGALLCWPICAATFIGMRLVEVEREFEQQGKSPEPRGE